MTTRLLLLALLLVGACRAPLVVASDLDNLPFAGVEDGAALGRDVEMMQQVSEELGRELVWRRLPFDELLDTVAAGEVDLVCATLGFTEERARRVRLTRPYFETSIAVVVRAGGDEPRSLDDLRGRRISGALGTTSQQAIERCLPDSTFAPGRKDGESSSIRLMRGEVDALVMDGPAAHALERESAGSLVVLASPLARESYVLAVRPDAPGLLAELDRVLEKLERTGVLRRLDQKHGLTSTPPPNASTLLP